MNDFGAPENDEMQQLEERRLQLEQGRNEGSKSSASAPAEGLIMWFVALWRLWGCDPRAPGDEPGVPVHEKDKLSAPSTGIATIATSSAPAEATGGAVGANVVSDTSLDCLVAAQGPLPPAPSALECELAAMLTSPSWQDFDSTGLVPAPFFNRPVVQPSRTFAAVNLQYLQLKTIL